MEEHILRLFFNRFGIIANMDRIYSESIKNILLQFFKDVELKSPQDEKICIEEKIDYEKYCLDKKITYEWEVNCDEMNSFRIPRMVSNKGYFVIDGIKKNPVIQELKSSYLVFTSLNEDNKEKTVNVKTRFLGSLFPLKIIYSIKYILIDISIFQKNMKEKKISEKSVISLQTLIYKMMKISYEELRSVFLKFKIWNNFNIAFNNDNIFNEDEENIIYDLIKNNIFGSNFNNRQILLTLAYLLKKAINVYENLEETSDRDNYVFKVLRSGGLIISQLLKTCLDEYYDKDFENISETDSIVSKSRKKTKRKKHIQQMIIEKIYSVFKLGYYTVAGRKYDKIVIDTGRRNIIDTIASVRKIVIPVDENSSNLKMRDLHDSQKRYVDPTETPESKKTGLLKYLCITTIISEYIDPELLIKTLSFWIDMELETDLNTKIVFLDGYVIGQLLSLNLKNIFDIKYLIPQLSVVVDKDFVFIRSFEGRPLRPVIVTSDLTKQENWNKYITSKQIQYFDPLEIEFATKQNRYFREISEDNLLGITSSLIPYISHNQGARAIFSTSQNKQTLTILNEHPKEIEDGKKIMYSQLPLVTTFMTRNINKFFNEEETPFMDGTNCVVFRMNYEGLTDEDAICISQGAIQRGLFMNFSKNSDKINCKGDPIILKTDKETIISDDLSRRPITTKMNVLKTQKNTIDLNSYTVSLLEIGDKISNNHAQKGVIAYIIPEADLPFSSDGTRPDIIVSPIGRIGRMTMGEIFEGILSRLCAQDGKLRTVPGIINESPYKIIEENSLPIDTIYSGFTGEKLKFSGLCAFDIVYMMALKHQTRDKQYMRYTGNINPITGQPLKGKKREGGPRLGEQEISAFVAHTSSSNLNEVSTRSDRGQFKICMNCPISDFPIDGDQCKKCLSSVETISLNFSIISFTRLLQTVSIGFNIKTKKYIYDRS